MKSLILILSLLFFAQTQAYKVETIDQTYNHGFYNGLVKGYERSTKWNDLVEVGDLNRLEVKTLLQGQTVNHRKRLLHCNRSYDAALKKNRKISNNLKKKCAIAFKEAVTEFMNNYSGSVADSVIKSALEALRKVNPKAYTVER